MLLKYLRLSAMIGDVIGLLEACMLSYAELAAHFRTPITQASESLGICQTSLKKMCRRYGLQRWPCRKLKLIDKKISGKKRHSNRPRDAPKRENMNGALHTRKRGGADVIQIHREVQFH
jgi:hypothetical protein